MSSAGGFETGKLLSLWEIMDVLDAKVVLEGMLWQSAQWHVWRMPNAPTLFQPEGHAMRLKQCQELAHSLAKVGLPICAGYQNQFVGVLERAKTHPNGDRELDSALLQEALHYLKRGLETLPDEAGVNLFLVVDARYKDLYQPSKPPFGEAVDRNFPIAIDDIRSAGECLALGQGTAAVFHLMRVMEAGLRGLARDLGIPYAPSWESYISQVNTLLGNYAKLTADQKEKRPFYQDVLGDLSAIKLAWRNPTMHIVKSYDVKQAKTVYDAVENLMRHLAAQLEPIEPVAISTGPVFP